MKVGFNPLRDMLLTIVAMSFLIYFLYRWKASRPDMLHQYYLHFDSSDIKGVIERISSRSNMEAIKVDNNDQGYLFTPNITDDGIYFHAYTEIGDSIIKPSYCRVITIKGKGGIYTYTFKPY